MKIEATHATLVSLRQHRKITRRRRRYRSRLDRYRADLVILRRAGAKIIELVCWLRRQRCKVSSSTVSRFLRHLPELQDQ